MSLYKSLLTAGVASAGLLAGLGQPALAQQAQDVIGKLGNNEGVFIDGRTFDIARGAANGDASAAIAKLGA